MCDRIESDVDEPAVQARLRRLKLIRILYCTTPYKTVTFLRFVSQPPPPPLMVVHVSVGSKPSPRAQRDTIRARTTRRLQRGRARRRKIEEFSRVREGRDDEKAIRHRRNENVSWDEGKRGLRQSETRVTVVETFSARVERSGRDHERKKRPRRVRLIRPFPLFGCKIHWKSRT